MFGQIILTDILKLHFQRNLCPLPNKYTKNDFEVSSIPPAWAVITVLMKCKTASFCMVIERSQITVYL